MQVLSVGLDFAELSDSSDKEASSLLGTSFELESVKVV